MSCKGVNQGDVKVVREDSWRRGRRVEGSYGGCSPGHTEQYLYVAHIMTMKL